MTKIGDKIFNTKDDVYIMGILNVTPDSFYDGGRYNIRDYALMRAEKMISEGAHIIDVGGESTRPGYTPVSEQEEVYRVVPVIESIKSNFDISVSVDTYKSNVASAAINAGADMINDIWGLKHDKNMAKVIANTNSACCLMHNRTNNNYTDFLNDVIIDLKESIDIAKSNGISDDKIIIDPGIGFAKNTHENLVITKNINQLDYLGYPILYAASNKSFIGNVLDADVNNRLEGTLACTAWAVARGCSFVRVHQVAENKKVIQMIKSIMGGI